ncbi:MAG: N-acetylmuramoyl-L-alanine amidase [Anaerolineae bacterium]|nr:N-acetylmuramoyl-L-alanine amidase [Anaerolineae bacterium]
MSRFIQPDGARSASDGHPHTPPPPRPRRWLWLLLALLAAVALVALLRLVWRRVAPLPRRICIIAGHWQYDSGATCPDGLREVDVTLPIARKVAERLKSHGYEAEVLPEYSGRLYGYRGLAVISLHADSCVDLTGFKVVGRGWTPSAAASARLAESLTRRYGAATGLAFHANTITPAMTGYHAFHKLAPDTPAAIVELGFLGADRELLTAAQERVVQGIVEGLIEFVGGAGRPTRTP